MCATAKDGGQVDLELIKVADSQLITPGFPFKTDQIAELTLQGKHVAIKSGKLCLQNAQYLFVVKY
jgi:hypothetical protein